MARILSGIQPSGQLHLGNYCGAVAQWVELQREHDCFIFVASYHALTTSESALELAARTRQIAIDLIALGIDPVRTCLYRQHDVPEVCELSWLLACVCPMSLADKGVSYKDKVAKGFDANLGLYTYPILQAADILAPRAEIVPVGRDQIQHIEIARDLAERFNRRWGEVFVVPRYRLAEAAEVLPGIDGQKMSKSYGNTIDPFADERTLRKRIMAIKSDSTPLDQPKDPESDPTFRIFRAVAGRDDPRTRELEAKYRQPPPGGFGYGHAKQALFELLLERFAAARRRREELLADPAEVERILAAGAARARSIAAATVAQARRACGLL
ncbi:MAG: tryptophan--tRNA ligase [Planctomycetota bacterium]|nr:tryptophan--tRNA ligase [Planctomycetota bacterium]MCX8040656.1 tryptophan--tRNA ligase [Planctomycetota bacterium]MDW8372799.1 tryptophan--tRNA ligase [Planctomycetota bacterium]